MNIDRKYEFVHNRKESKNIMPTEKARFTVIVEDELLKKVDDFQFGNRYRSRSSAAVELIKIAMDALEGKEPQEPQKKEPALSEQEEDLLALFRRLEGEKQTEVLSFINFKISENKTTPPR